MKKKILIFALLLAICCSLFTPVYADTLPRVVDGADLLYPEDEAALEQKIAEVSTAYNFDIVIVTTDSLEGKTAEAYADDYFDYNGYGYGESYDGIILAVSMAEREWAISTCGYGLEAFSDYDTDRMGEEIVYYLSDSFYYDACLKFVEMTEDELYYASLDSYNESGSFSTFLFFLPIALIIGFVISLCIGFGFKGQLKTARPKAYAGDYVKKGSFNLRRSNDIYLYSRTSRVKIESNSSSRGGTTSHISSSGRSHGGSSGKF